MLPIFYVFCALVVSFSLIHIIFKWVYISFYISTCKPFSVLLRRMEKQRGRGRARESLHLMSLLIMQDVFHLLLNIIQEITPFTLFSVRFFFFIFILFVGVLNMAFSSSYSIVFTRAPLQPFVSLKKMLQTIHISSPLHNDRPPKIIWHLVNPDFTPCVVAWALGIA